MELDSRICDLIQEVVEDVKKEYILKNSIIKDGIFQILEKHCVVLYYPLPDENKNRGFHIKRFLEGELEDFVYINTAKSTAEQVFAAAHELGHVWEVASKVWDKMGESSPLTEETEEIIVNRFAAELLMPEKEFRATFYKHIEELGFNTTYVRFGDLIRVMVKQMADYMVPYEAVRRRMVETAIISERIGEELLENSNKIIGNLVSAYLKDLNTTLEEKSGKKTIPGLRDALEKAESKGKLSQYVISKVKADFSIENVDMTEQIIELSAEGK